MKISELADWMTRGGDARIVLDPESGLNRYHSAPYPRDVLAFASSTANDLSADAMAFLETEFAGGAAGLESGGDYTAYLDRLRGRISAAYRLPGGTDIFFAPSGTDLEYVALLAIAGRKPNGMANLLLGADEVGSGCIHSAAGRYFANETALVANVKPGQEIEGLPPIEMGDFPVRNPEGEAFDSDMLTVQMEVAIARALAEGRYPLVHVVHGSKTGLVLPHLDDIDRLKARFKGDVAFVVDACQARITTQAIHDYLARDIIVFLTGSKFMGGPPFSGFALLPAGMVAAAAPLAAGMATVFSRAEIPAGWAGAEALPDSGNAGLALRLSASLFELERFQKLSIARVTRVVSAFNQAAGKLAERLRARKVAAAPAEDADEEFEHPIEMQTLVTLDLCHNSAGEISRTLDFDAAVAIHKAMTADGVRLGQPVRCVKLADGRWGATLRVGLSMPQVVRLDGVGDAELGEWMQGAMDRIAAALEPRLG
ncbi:MAG: hypothetical protein IPG54_08885 [Sphingomonadales bacterium]|jgi:hypothetical protein|nr:hypothetical protein [Sphingomonadales bacterium]MBK9004953.1 hypothetical protein [Sphingomonadales bacterium]MBK9267314.1 hypothetical protein [Sphingomonadales bacterium]MBP6434009.1 hypothetical protein [Sphingorhabdus sp.]